MIDNITKYVYALLLMWEDSSCKDNYHDISGFNGKDQIVSKMK